MMDETSDENDDDVVAKDLENPINEKPHKNPWLPPPITNLIAGLPKHSNDQDDEGRCIRLVDRQCGSIHLNQLE
jgi:hypothetical protein